MDTEKNRSIWGFEKTVLKTKRLLLHPMDDEEIRALIDRTEDGELKAAYGEMLEGCENDPENRIWYAPWAMELKEDGTYIGDIGFKGPVKDDAVEIGYGVLKEYEGNGYATEAAGELVNWAFDQDGVWYVEAEAEESNKASLRVIRKLGMTEYGKGEEGPRFAVEKKKTKYLAMCVGLGAAAGVSVGRLLFNSSLLKGMCSGMALGAGIGTTLEEVEKNKRLAVRERRQERLEKEAKKDTQPEAGTDIQTEG